MDNNGCVTNRISTFLSSGYSIAVAVDLNVQMVCFLRQLEVVWFVRGPLSLTPSTNGRCKVFCAAHFNAHPANIGNIRSVHFSRTLFGSVRSSRSHNLRMFVRPSVWFKLVYRALNLNHSGSGLS